MSIRPVEFHEDGSIVVVHDDLLLAHDPAGTTPQPAIGTVQLADVRYSRKLAGGDDLRYLEIPCPAGCGSVSVHPIGGGADPERIQALHALKRAAIPANRTRPFSEILGEIETEADRMDGKGRFRLRDVERPHIESGTREPPTAERDRDRPAEPREGGS